MCTAPHLSCLPDCVLTPAPPCLPPPPRPPLPQMLAQAQADVAAAAGCEGVPDAELAGVSERPMSDELKGLRDKRNIIRAQFTVRRFACAGIYVVRRFACAGVCVVRRFTCAGIYVVRQFACAGVCVVRRFACAGICVVRQFARAGVCVTAYDDVCGSVCVGCGLEGAYVHGAYVEGGGWGVCMVHVRTVCQGS